MSLLVPDLCELSKLLRLPILRLTLALTIFTISL
jgi:hypothetical protein